MNDRFRECRSRSSHWAWLLALLLAGSARSAEPAYTPEQELSAFKLAEGYEAHLFASETDGVIKPIQMRFDPEGRLWIACSTIYPQIKPGEIPNDKIIVIEDTNGDGRADKTTVFADGLMIPTGLEFGGGGLYVGNGTQLLHLADTDGDGRADQRRVVLRGFGTGDSHQNINSFCWSPGGQLFMSQGLHAFSDVETPHGIERLHQAGIWRFTPKELRLEPFFGNGVTPQNPWGFVWDDWATPFMVAGNGDGVYWLSPALVRTTHRRDVQRIFNPGNKYCGVDIVGTKHLPPTVQGKLIAGGFMNNRIVVFRFEDQGSGFVLKEETPLLVSSDVSFRPVDVKVGPDGAIYVADWCNPIIGHYQASFRDPRRDKEHGRIWRITAKGRPLVPRAKLAGATEGELLDQLRLGERWPRYQARRVLAERKPEEVRQAVDRWVKSLDASDPSCERNLVEGLGVYEMINAAEPNLLGRLLAAKDFRARAYATEVLGRWGSARGDTRPTLNDALALLSKQAADEHPRVRLQAVVAASRIPDERSIEVALTAVDRPVDRFLEDALVQTVFALKEQWLPGFIAGRLNFSEKANRLEYLLKTDGSADTLRATVERLRDPGLGRETKGSLLTVIANVGGPAELAMVLDSKKYVDANGAYDPEFQSRLLPQLAIAYELRRVKPAGDLNQAIGPMIQSSNAALRAEAFKLAGKWNLEGYRASFESAVDSTSEPLPVRVAAVEALASLTTAVAREEGAAAALRKVSGSAYPGPLRAAAVIAELRLDAHAAAEDAAILLAQPLEDALVEQVVGAFLLRQKAVDQLADALKVRKPTTDAARIGLRRMSATGQANQKLASVLAEAVGLPQEKRQLDVAQIASLADEVRKQGQGSHGAEIYARTELNCAACHTVSGKGGNIGPDLSALGTAQPVEFIIGAILYPNREVKEGFMAIEVETKSGETHQGYVLRENTDELVLRDVTAGQEIRLAKREIASRQQRGSVMPEGLADTLTRTEFRDLVRFLSDLGR